MDYRQWFLVCMSGTSRINSQLTWWGERTVVWTGVIRSDPSVSWEVHRSRGMISNCMKDITTDGYYHSGAGRCDVAHIERQEWSDFSNTVKNVMKLSIRHVWTHTGIFLFPPRPVGFWGTTQRWTSGAIVWVNSIPILKAEEHCYREEHCYSYCEITIQCDSLVLNSQNY